MADSAIRKTEDSPPSSKPSSNPTSKPVRHVVFSEIPRRPHKPDKERRRGRCCSGCFVVCCAWGCMIGFALVLVLLVVAAIFVAFLHSEMPEVHVARVSIPSLDVVTASSQQALLSADVDIVVEVSNKNDRAKLSYGTMTVDVSSEKISLGQTKVVAFSQKPKNSTELKIHTKVTRLAVDKEDGAFLKSNVKDGEMVFDVVLSGTIGVGVGRFTINGLPVTMACHGIQQSQVDIGQEPKCSVKMFSFRK
ncbi:hypothetical protein L1049_013279 [Liquidambar formosana]|uniref:Late embryogenesis abundant protein LEA-2 subgroup domain-containing protein n=1 Tax=Liquidambar formosana TaxID=63359 RepID=A0AAP0RKY4_LIQFO